ncbi:unannotated protein [freshwater metagenome]|uniref:Unannotated protein n=1 Tax=freshwater metagenome TaxID=449393 RepID=A0A6J7IE28_9ZZZZ
MAGDARGRRLIAPEGRETRPTLDRIRESMFNALASLDAIEGARVLDLFAGSGALGIEALSRGADHVTFVDSDRNARRAIETNLISTGYTDRAEVIASTADAYLARAGAAAQPHSLVLLDPPYGFDDDAWTTVLDVLHGRRGIELIVIESSREVAVPRRWDAVRQKWYGGTLVSIFTPADPPPSETPASEKAASQTAASQTPTSQTLMELS